MSTPTMIGHRWSPEAVEAAAFAHCVMPLAPVAEVREQGPAIYVRGEGVRLDARTRMMYDRRHVFINGESFMAGGRDARLMRQLADHRQLSAKEVAALSVQARDLLDDWVDAGWLQAVQIDSPSVV